MEKFVVDEYVLDSEQTGVVLNSDNNLLVIAGAGSGKTLTIVGKIRYLINDLSVKPEEILCLSFTNDATESLKEKLRNDKIDVMTFHKLGLHILKDNEKNLNISKSDYLDYVVEEFLLGIIFESNILMKKVLSYFNIFLYFDVEKRYKRFINEEYNRINSLKKLIIKFLKLLKTNNYYIDSFILFKKCSFSRKERNFLSLALNIYLIYENELRSSGSVDFDDMLIESRKIIENGGFVKNYKYIIIDEYQDTSYIRYLLIKSILEKTKAKFIAVGDDFQSIYRFTGSDLDIFTSFGECFENAKILKLQNTYRNSMELIDVAGNFIMKNKNQIIKKLKSNKTIFRPIKICYDMSLKKLIQDICGNIMILGRNNNDIFEYIDNNFLFDGENLIYENNQGKKIRYLTIHRSKGLEEENVIVLNVVDSKYGIPNKIEDDKILRFVSKSKNYLYDEERRLFYVALTRTKNNVYLMTKRFSESIFIKEILRSNPEKIEIMY